MIKLWLDDVRPAPDGWTWCKSVQEAIQVMKSGQVEEMSLDHDLGYCQNCDNFPSKECEKHRNGRALVLFMIEENNWPKQKPRVHSNNAAGIEWMTGMIERYWPGDR